MRKKTTEEFIKEAINVHGKKYDYSKVEYKGCFDKVCIICSKHDEFWQTPANHLYGKGCKECGVESIKKKQRLSIVDFIDKSNLKHNNKYDYSKVEYVNNHTKVSIVCPIHDVFFQTPNDHLNGYGCPFCGGTAKLNTNLFVEKSKEIHNDKYDYSKVEYINSHNKVCIICPKHGEFWQTPNSHLNGSGCFQCKSSHMENQIRSLLKENNIVFEEQKRFKWLGLQSLDFYLPDQNIAIECQGIQHFREIHFFNNNNGYNILKRRDEEKKKMCNKNNIKIIYFANYKIDFPYNVVTDEETLISLIKNKI